MSQKCLAKPRKFAQALEINEEIVCNIATIIKSFKRKKPLDLDKLEQFCLNANNLHFHLSMG